MRKVGAWLAWAAAIAVVLSLVASARAQEALSEALPLGTLVFCDQDLTELDKAATLSPAQREAVESLMRSAIARARSVHSKYAVQWSDMAEKYAEATKGDPNGQSAFETYMSDFQRSAQVANKEIAAIERETLVDIRATLTKEQLARGWPTFERSRRRLLLTLYQGGGGMGWSPRQLVRAIKLEGDDVAAAEGVLDRYELELDPLLVQRLHALSRLNAEAAESGKYDTTMGERSELMAAQINKLNIRAAQAVEGALSASGRTLFLRERIGMELRGFSQRPAMDQRVRQIMRLESLSEDQRTKGAELVAKADAQAYEAAVVELHRRDAAALRDEKIDAAAQAAQMAKTQEALMAPTSALVKQLRALLTPAQLEDINEPYFVKRGEDPFKADRSPKVKSEWNEDPMKKTENDP